MPYSNYSKGSKAAASAMRKYARKKKYDGDMDGDKAEEREDSSDYGKTMKRLKRMRGGSKKY